MDLDDGELGPSHRPSQGPVYEGNVVSNYTRSPRGCPEVAYS